MYASVNFIGSDNGLVPGRHQAIIWTNGGIFIIRTLGTNSFIFIQENAFEYAVFEMLAILSQPYMSWYIQAWWYIYMHQ